MSKTITFKQKSFRLVGRGLALGQKAHNFQVTTGNLNDIFPLELAKDKIKLITSFISLDTPVCDLQVKEFNQQAIKLSKDVAIFAISKDLPFAQKRFCEIFSIQNIQVLSDYKSSSFGINYGLLIQDLNLLARAVIILDKNNIVRYLEIVPEVTNPPDYQKAIQELLKVVENPTLPLVKESVSDRCVPCEGKVPALDPGKISCYLKEVKNWDLSEDGKKLEKSFRFKDFNEAKYFLDLVALMASEQNHHPVATLGFNYVQISLTTYASHGLTENDFVMARIMDELSW